MTPFSTLLYVRVVSSRPEADISQVPGEAEACEYTYRSRLLGLASALPTVEALEPEDDGEPGRVVACGFPDLAAAAARFLFELSRA